MANNFNGRRKKEGSKIFEKEEGRREKEVKKSPEEGRNSTQLSFLPWLMIRKSTKKYKEKYKQYKEKGWNGTYLWFFFNIFTFVFSKLFNDPISNPFQNYCRYRTFLYSKHFSLWNYCSYYSSRFFAIIMFLSHLSDNYVRNEVFMFSIICKVVLENWKWLL